MTEFDAVILDVDGTIVRGEELLPGVTEGIQAIVDAGCELLLFSNNPTRDGDHYRGLLARHGIETATVPAFTSATLAATFLTETHPDERIFLVGSDRLATILEAAGVDLTDEPTAADVVLGSYDPDFSYDQLNGTIDALTGETPFYGTDPDPTIPTDTGEVPGTGAVLAAMEAVAGRPPDAILGKPSAIAAEVVLSTLTAEPPRTLVVGDRLDTDIALGKRAGLSTAVVLTGITDRAALESASVEPDVVLESLGEVDRLLE